MRVRVAKLSRLCVCEGEGACSSSSSNAWWSSCRKKTVASLARRLNVPTVFIPCRGVAHSSPSTRTPDPRHTQCQTKHGAYVGVTQGQPEKNARSWGVSRSVRVAVVPWPPSRWPVGSLLTRTEDRREGGGRVQTGRSGVQLKRRLVLLFSKNSRTIL